MRHFTKPVLSLFVLGLVVTGLLSYQFISAQTWTNPPANPPSSNASAPINVGSSNQTKSGGLTINGAMDVNNSLGANTINLFATGPTIRYVDSDQRDFWTHVNNDAFYVLVDRNGDGSWDSPHPLVVHANQNSNVDYVLVNDVRASEYCDRNGNNCFTAAEASCVSMPYVRTITVAFTSGSSLVNCATDDWDCMASYCRNTYGGWAGYHAARTGGFAVFSCYDWDITSSCDNSAINKANERETRSY